MARPKTWNSCEACREVVNVERGPIFVGGSERSGTSLMFALLASHPRIAMTRRTNLWTHFYNQYGDLTDPQNLERCLDVMMRYKRLIILQPDVGQLRRDFWAGDPTYARLFFLLEEQYAKRLGKPRWGDKSLHTERYADLILAAYPGARMLHMVRDPRDRYASSQTRWGVGRGGVGAGTAEWLSSTRLANRNEERYPDRYKIIRYETLASQPEDTLRGICAFIGEEYAPQMMSMEGAPEFKRRGSNSSYGRRVGGVISTRSIGRFREVLPPRQIAFIQMLAKDKMVSFDYEPERIHLLVTQRLRFAIADLPLELAHLVAWQAREMIRDRIGRPVGAYRLVEGARVP
jgi:sulfotransferase family protein